jgi:hypothetical protein
VHADAEIEGVSPSPKWYWPVISPSTRVVVFGTGMKRSSSISAFRSPRKPFGLPVGEAYLSKGTTRI